MSTDETKQTRNGLDRVAKRFPSDIDKLKELHELSPTFREINSDYDEISSWLEDHCQCAKEPSSSCENALDLSRELEAEIVACLEGSHALVGLELDNGALDILR